MQSRTEKATVSNTAAHTSKAAKSSKSFLQFESDEVAEDEDEDDDDDEEVGR